MSFTHMIILGIIALIVIPPEKLPEVAREIARFLSELKNSADQIMGELKRDAIFKPEDILDKNIKQKLADLQNDLNKNVNAAPGHSGHSVNQAAQPAATVAPGAAPAASGESSTDTDGGNKS